MKSTNIQDYITRSNKAPWKPLKEEGVNTDGIWVKSLRYDELDTPEHTDPSKSGVKT